MWKTLKLIDIVNIEIGKTPSRKNPKYWDKNKKGSNVWLSIRDMSKVEGLYIGDSKEYISDEGAKLFKEVPKNTLIMSFKLSIGKLAITKINLRTNEAIAAFKIKDAALVSNKYLYYFLSSINWDRLAGSDIKVKGKTLNKAKLKEILITLPPLPEQQRIVAKLDAAFTEIDKVIATTYKNIENINALFENYLINYFSNKKYKQIKLEDVCTATQGVQISKSNQIKSFKKGYLRYLYISDFSNNKNIKYVENKYPKKIVKPSDIIVANTGASAGSIFRGIEGILSNNLFKVSSNEKLIDSDFLYYFVISKLFKNFQKKIMRGTANPHMGHENFLKTPLSLPHLDDQKEIISKIFELENNIKTLNQNYSNKINTLCQLKLNFLSFNLNNTKAA